MSYTSNIDAYLLSLKFGNFEYKDLKIVPKWMSLNDGSEIGYSSNPVLIRQNCIWGSVWCASRSVYVQFDINLATSVTAVRELTLVSTQVSYCPSDRSLKF